jgi:Spy/CpxP family protein refolding chaperone
MISSKVMNMSRKTLGWLLIFSVIINISTLATVGYYRWFKQKRHSFTMDRSAHKEFLTKKLGLTEEQSQKIEELRSKLWQQIKPLKSQLDDERRHFFQILNQDTVNIEDVYSSIDRISEIQKQMQRETAENMLAHQSIFTPEQRKNFFSMMANRMQMGDAKRRHSPRSMEDKNINKNNEEKQR